MQTHLPVVEPQGLWDSRQGAGKRSPCSSRSRWQESAPAACLGHGWSRSQESLQKNWQVCSGVPVQWEGPGTNQVKDQRRWLPVLGSITSVPQPFGVPFSNPKLWLGVGWLHHLVRSTRPSQLPQKQILDFSWSLWNRQGIFHWGCRSSGMWSWSCWGDGEGES